MRYLILTLCLAGALAYGDTDDHHLELGIGIGGLGAPDYRGSREYRRTISPIPYFVYRGRYLKADREGLRSDLFRREWFELNLSASATITPESHRTPLREGMPNLYSTVELGPALNINLTGERINEGWVASLPLRRVIAVSGSLKSVGWVLHPQVVRRWQTRQRTLTLRTGPVFADRSFHRYYYRVAPAYVTPARPQFDVGGGYSGWSSQVVLSRRRGNWWYGVFARYDNLSGAVFVDSPLLETRHVVNIGGGISWVLF